MSESNDERINLYVDEDGNLMTEFETRIAHMVKTKVEKELNANTGNGKENIKD